MIEALKAIAKVAKLAHTLLKLARPKPGPRIEPLPPKQKK